MEESKGEESKGKELEARIEELEKKQQVDWNDRVVPICIAVLTFWASCAIIVDTIAIVIKIVSS